MDAKKLKSYLECPVCLLVPKAKILACSNGHKICESCHKKLKTVAQAKKCPLGGCDYSNPPLRIRDLEAIVENSDVKLSCSLSGCRVEMTRQDLKIHEEGFKYRLVPCPKTSCQEMIRFNDISSHITKHHKDKFYLISVPKIKLNIYASDLEQSDFSGRPRIWSFSEHKFYAQIEKYNNVWYFWVQIEGDPTLANKWRFSAKTENIAKGIRMEFSGAVLPVDLSGGEAIETGECLMMKNKNIEKLMFNDRIVITFNVFSI